MLKTRKSFAERLRTTKRGKVLRRKTQLGHFKAKDRGTMTQRKRKDIRGENHPEIQKSLRKYVPGV